LSCPSRSKYPTECPPPPSPFPTHTHFLHLLGYWETMLASHTTFAGAVCRQPLPASRARRRTSPSHPPGTVSASTAHAQRGAVKAVRCATASPRAHTAAPLVGAHWQGTRGWGSSMNMPRAVCVPMPVQCDCDLCTVGVHPSACVGSPPRAWKYAFGGSLVHVC
jgi:hypothetical protein